MDVKDLDSLKNELQEGQVVSSINILFLDISSSCTGYAVASVDFSTKSVEWKNIGALWFDSKWTHQEKYGYMFGALTNYFFVTGQSDYIVAEAYSINPKKMGGVTVIPELHGVVKVGAWENGIKVSSIPPQTWRSILGIKPNVVTTSKGNKKRDYKTPTKEKVEEYISNIPDKITSNITKNARQTPSDLYDAVSIGMAWLDRLGFDYTKHDYSKVEINGHIGVV